MLRPFCHSPETTVDILEQVIVATSDSASAYTAILQALEPAADPMDPTGGVSFLYG